MGCNNPVFLGLTRVKPCSRRVTRNRDTIDSLPIFGSSNGRLGMNDDNAPTEPIETEEMEDAPEAKPDLNVQRACRKCGAITSTSAEVCPKCGANYSRRGLREFAPVSTLAAVAIAIPLIAAAFLLGQSTRKSDDEVHRDIVVARTAQKSFDTKRAQVKTHNLLQRQEKKLKKVFNKRAKIRANKAYESGSSSGYSSGYKSGSVDGLIEGSDELSCSDDPDVTWLPAC